MRTLIIASIIFWLIVGLAFGQTTPNTDYKLRVKNNSLVVSYQKKTHRLQLKDEIDAARVTGAAILFARRAGDYTYLVVDVSGMSKEKSDDRQCGAGVEANLIWLKLDAAWQIAAVDSVRYESCWAPVTAGDGYRIEGSVLTMDYEDFRDNVAVKLSYDNERPEKGFEKKSSPIEAP